MLFKYADFITIWLTELALVILLAISTKFPRASNTTTPPSIML